VLKVQKQLLRVGPASDIDRILESGVEAAYVEEPGGAAVELADDCCDHWIVGTFAHVAHQKHYAGIVAVVGKMVGLYELADHLARKIRCAVAQNPELGNADCSAVRAGPSFEAKVGSLAAAADEPSAAVWDDAGEAIQVAL